MGRGTAIGVHNNLASRQTCIAVRATNHKGPRWVDPPFGVRCEPFGRHDLADIGLNNATNIGAVLIF